MMILLIHRLPDLLIVVLSAWLGLGLLVRTPYDRTTRAFAWFCAHMVLYGITAIQTQLTTSQTVAMMLGRIQLAATVLTPVAFLYFVVALISYGRIKPIHTVLVVVCHALGAAMALYAMFGTLSRTMPPFPPWAPWGEPRYPDGLLTWLYTTQRATPLLIAIFLMLITYWSTPTSVHEPRLRRVLSITALLGVIGALGAAAARELSFSPAPARAVIVVAMLVFTYTVITHRALLRTARRAFLYSVLGSLFTMCYVVVVLILEWGAGELLQINIPLVSALSIVGLAAAFGPVVEWARTVIDRRFYPREFDYSRMLKSLGDELFERGSLHEQLQAGLSSICRALDVQSGMVALVTPNGLEPRAWYGEEQPVALLPSATVPDEMQDVTETWEPWPAARLLLPLQRGQEQVALLALGKRATEQTEQDFTATERALLNHLCNYLTLTIEHARAQDEHQSVMMTLAEQSKMLREQQDQLARQAQEAAQQAEATVQKKKPAPQADGLRVYALGPLRVESNGEPITRWGGSKAGTYQAEALFAFLYDRLGKGITKDEAEEVIWPELELSKADSAFHRTLAGLRRTLEPGLRRGNLSRVILYHHDRYWLQPDAIAWCDTDAFIAAAEQGITRYHQNDLNGALELLEQASQIYRGDYMDDCPFYGDSTYVEEHRTALNERYRDVQLTLGAIYEAQSRVGEAVSTYRRALTLSANGCPQASEGLARLQEG